MLSLGCGAFAYVALASDSCLSAFFGVSLGRSEAVVGTSHHVLWYAIITPVAARLQILRQAVYDSLGCCSWDAVEI